MKGPEDDGHEYAQGAAVVHGVQSENILVLTEICLASGNFTRTAWGRGHHSGQAGSGARYNWMIDARKGPDEGAEGDLFEVPPRLRRLHS